MEGLMAENVENNVVSEAHEDDPVEVADKPREPTTYEKKLRTEARQHRLKREEAERDRDARIAAAEASANDRVAAAESRANARVIRAELKALAVKEGIIDIDAMNLLDVSGLKVNDAGEVEGGAEAIARFKEAKPHFFSGAKGTSSTEQTPKPGEQKVDARTMSAEEYRAARANLTGRK